MKLKEYKKLNNRRYSPKEVLAHLIVSSDNIISKDIEHLQNSLEEVFLQNYNNKGILENVKLELLEKITNYWSLTLNQAMCYGHIIFNNIIFEDKKITPEEVTDMFIYVMRLYSPNNAEEFVNLKVNKEG